MLFEDADVLNDTETCCRNANDLHAVTSSTHSMNVAIALQSSAIVMICRLSVTQVYFDKTTEARIMQFPLQGSTRTPLSAG